MSSTTAAIKGSGGGGKGEGVAVAEVKKKVDGSAVARPSSVKVVAKLEGKTNSSSSKTATLTNKTKAVKAKSEKKVYSLPGQKFDPPEEREPLRIFYESLSKQIPSSEMAEFWMMEHGLLSPERAKKAFARKPKRQQELRMGTPIKSVKQEKPESSKKSQASMNGDIKAKKRVEYSDDDDDFILKMKKLKGFNMHQTVSNQENELRQESVMTRS